MEYGFSLDLRKFDSTSLLLRNCKTMSAKFLLNRSILNFYNNVSNGKVSLVHNLWCWFHSSELCKSLLKYELSDVNSRCVIHHVVAVAFGVYCNDLADDVE